MIGTHKEGTGSGETWYPTYIECILDVQIDRVYIKNLSAYRRAINKRQGDIFDHSPDRWFDSLLEPFAMIDLKTAPHLDPLAQRVLLTLADHHVKGDEILKGIKAYINITTPIKIQESYLGGWNVVIDGDLHTVGTLIHSLHGNV